MKHYLFTEIVDKVFLYTGSSSCDSRYNGLMTLAKVIEENRLEIHKHVHNLRCELNHVSDSINGNLESYDYFDHWSCKAGSEAYDLDSCMKLANRTREHLFLPLKEMLQPVWKVYWSEGCNTFSNIALWLDKADQDNGEKVKLFLESKQG